MSLKISSALYDDSFARTAKRPIRMSAAASCSAKPTTRRST